MSVPLNALKEAQKRLRGAGMLGGDDDIINMAIAELRDPTPQTTPTRDEAPDVLAKQVTAAASDMCEIARIAGEWRNGPKQSLTAIREIRAVLDPTPAPASGEVDAVKAEGFVDGYEAALRDVQVFRIKVAEPFDSTFATHKGFVTDMLKVNAGRLRASLSPAATPVSEAGGEP